MKEIYFLHKTKEFFSGENKRWQKFACAKIYLQTMAKIYLRKTEPIAKTYESDLKVWIGICEYYFFALVSRVRARHICEDYTHM
jgi:hypothetical protein